MKLKEEVGFVISVNDYLLYIEGLPSARVNDVIISENGGRALVNSLDSQRIKALMLDVINIKPGDLFRLSSEGLRLPLGQYLLGRTISPLGLPIDGREALPVHQGSKLELDVVATGIYSREPIEEQLITGFTLVDVLLPLGKGQRELIFGDARSGKSSLLLDVIINQKGRDTICVYVAIGKPEIDTKRFANTIQEAGADGHTVILAASSNHASPLIAIAPSVGLAIAEHFSKQGRNVLLVLDDLGVHAKYLREIALLSQQIPGRESYPGGIFYAHSSLMERSGRFKDEYGGGSITLLPVIETELENFTNLIPTNLMSQTDGHLLFSAALNSQGQYPAIDWNRSVTRVGRQTQSQLQKLVGNEIRSLLAEYQELATFSQFETELSEQSQQTLKQARLAIELLRQESQQGLDPSLQVALLGLIFTPFFKDRDLEFLRANKQKIVEGLREAPEFKQILALPPTDLEQLTQQLTSNLGILEALCH